MYIINPPGFMVVNSEFVEMFLIVDKSDAALIVASYGQERAPVTLARYKNTKEAVEVLNEMFFALNGGQTGYTMPDSVLYYEQDIKKDARTKRKGGS